MTTNDYEWQMFFRFALCEIGLFRISVNPFYPCNPRSIAIGKNKDVRRETREVKRERSTNEWQSMTTNDDLFYALRFALCALRKRIIWISANPFYPCNPRSIAIGETRDVRRETKDEKRQTRNFKGEKWKARGNNWMTTNDYEWQPLFRYALCSLRFARDSMFLQ